MHRRSLLRLVSRCRITLTTNTSPPSYSVAIISESVFFLIQEALLPGSQAQAARESNANSHIIFIKWQSQRLSPIIRKRRMSATGKEESLDTWWTTWFTPINRSPRSQRPRSTLWWLIKSRTSPCWSLVVSWAWAQKSLRNVKMADQLGTRSFRSSSINAPSRRTCLLYS